MCAAALILIAVAAQPVPPAALENVATFARDTGSVLAWPAQLQLGEGLLLGAVTVGTVALFRADTHLYGQLNGVHWTMHRRSVFNATLHFGNGLVNLAAVGLLALGGERGRNAAVAGVQALASVAVTTILLKHLFRVERPSEDPLHKRYFSEFEDDAFPSGHTMSAFATATVIAQTYPSAAPFAYGVASLVGLSVMKRGWHWPSDVLAGAALGVVIGRVSLRVRSRRVLLTGRGVAVEM
jgi:undecaprenyl-diphosphatase